MNGLKKASTVNREQAQAKVMQWAAQSGFKATSLEDSKHDFVIEVSETEKLPDLQIIHQSADAPFVLVVGLVNIPETDRERLKDLKQEHYNEFIWDIKLNILRGDVDFTVLGPEKDPDAWEVQKRLFLTETNINHFHEAYSKVKNALIGIIWSYKRALDNPMVRTERSESEAQIMSGDVEVSQSELDRAEKVMNAMINTSIILMSTLMGGLTEAMMEAMGSMATEMAGAIGGEEEKEKVNNELEQKLPEVDGKMQEMMSEVRRDVYAQLDQKRGEIEPFLSDAAFDLGPMIIDEYEFGLPKLTEELDDVSLVKYSQLLIGEDPSFTEMFEKLTNWMNTLPKFPVSEKE